MLRLELAETGEVLGLDGNGKDTELRSGAGSNLMVTGLLVDEGGISMSGASADATADGNSLQGVVTERVFRGDRYEVRVQVGNGEIFCHAAADAAPGPVQSGQSVTLAIDPRSVRVLQGGN